MLRLYYNFGHGAMVPEWSVDYGDISTRRYCREVFLNRCYGGTGFCPNPAPKEPMSWLEFEGCTLDYHEEISYIMG